MAEVRWAATLRLTAFVLLVSSFARGERHGQPIAFGNVSTDLKSWRQLATDAGYFIPDGTWRGGLPKSQRLTTYKIFTCDKTHPTSGHCLQWSGGVVPGSVLIIIGEHDNDTFRQGVVCQKSQCLSRLEHDTCRPALSCTESEGTHITDCVCESAPSKENPYCHEWRCIQYGLHGIEQEERYDCVLEDGSREYCDRWTGDAYSESRVKSIRCDCLQNESKHCALWSCESRSILRCDKHFPVWCDLRVAVGLYGTFSLFFLLALFCVIYRFSENWSVPKKVFVSIVGFGLLVAPWLIAVTLVGGFRALGWVMLMIGASVAVAVGFLACTYTRDKSHKPFLLNKLVERVTIDLRTSINVSTSLEAKELD